AFTGAHDSRKGYFEVADGGTIFLDEVADLPLSTQVRLLRVLETGEFIKVGSSKTMKTNVRVVAATNLDITKAIEKDKFREDLYYRLNTVPIFIPPLRERHGDIHLLFRKFASDFADRYRMPAIVLDEKAREMLEKYRWPGNIRQQKNITEQISVIEQNREIGAEELKKYMPDYQEAKVPALYANVDQKTFSSEREILYKILFDMRNDMNDLKKLVLEMMQKGNHDEDMIENNAHIIKKLYQSVEPVVENPEGTEADHHQPGPLELKHQENNIQDTEEIVEESLSLEDKEIELIKKALEKHNGKRKNAAHELGISERTLYRKIKEHNIE
ncbi:MAG TPA: sigma 54-interacting transcriptional regulator, partial [Bacteroidales bacterium]|nr:sigma 54-interacting transcriptional regulator [Bacteroidales bacterium]